MYYLFMIALVSLTICIFVTAWRADKIIEDYSSTIVALTRKSGLDLYVPNQVPLDHWQKVKIIKDAKQIQSVSSRADISDLEAKYFTIKWIGALQIVLGVILVSVWNSVDFL